MMDDDLSVGDDDDGDDKDDDCDGGKIGWCFGLVWELGACSFVDRWLGWFDGLVVWYSSLVVWWLDGLDRYALGWVGLVD